MPKIIKNERKNYKVALLFSTNLQLADFNPLNRLAN